MPNLRFWAQKSSKWFSDPRPTDTQDISNQPTPLDAAELSRLSCHCHPDLQPERPHILCKACQHFVDECHWIQNYKLPPQKRKQLSERHWKRKAYLADGDAAEGLNWSYELSQDGRSKACHVCQLIGTVWENSASVIDYIDFMHSARVELWVYYVQKDEGHARLGILAQVHNSQAYGYLPARVRHDSSNTAADRGSAPSGAGLSLRMGRCTGSNANFEIAKNWINTCVQTHFVCNASGLVTTEYPARLIDVGTESDKPHLHELIQNVPVPNYLTLSHCWGGHSPVRLTATTVEEFKHGIPLSSLSKTFQDAIFIVRSLGYKYVWIDSLCIIQDSVEDWRHESTLMGAIYRNSVCTIAATASKDGDGGCFRLRSALRHGPCQLWAGDERAIFLDLEENFIRDRYSRKVNAGPLNSRAWVAQERILSPRILHYADGAVYWDCGECHLCDTGYQTLDDNPLSWGFGDRDIRVLDGISGSPDEFSERWQSSVEKYCEMQLTRNSDRLIAFLGIIKHSEKVSGLECNFGLWKNYVLQHLLWRVEDTSSGSIERTSDELPTWSWASIGGGVRYFPPHKDNIAMTFWYPDGENGFVNETKRLSDPNLVDDVVAGIFEEMELGVDPTRGYSSEKIYCASFEDDLSSEGIICVSGKLNTPAGTVMVVRDELWKDEETQIMTTIQFTARDSAIDHKHLICIWLDLPVQSSTDQLLFLRICIQGARKPKMERFFGTPSEGIPFDPEPPLIAPYALHTTGLALEPTGKKDQYSRVGFFRSIETFGTSPAPHPKGVDPESPLFKDSWFGENCVPRIVKIL